jgi:hypothetical protein
MNKIIEEGAVQGRVYRLVGFGDRDACQYRFNQAETRNWRKGILVFYKQEEASNTFPLAGRYVFIGDKDKLNDLYLIQPILKTVDQYQEARFIAKLKERGLLP